ncbi:MAG TPA: helicase C-terminal domain-containing protein, partial [Bacteroidales bacterium]|nr:helicase C-terminal domain-containing protein [Bacteroidales bacterium]
LKRIADYYPNIYGIVFCRTRQETQEIADSLIRDGYSAEALHGDLSQSQRDYVMNKFRIRHLKMLVATDVAARGIDVDDLTHVINYNMPDELEIYVHRSGRTGRAGRSGISISIINLKEKHKIRLLEKQVGKEFSQAKIPSGHQICEKQLYHVIEKMENVEVNEEEVEEFLPVIYKKLKWMSQEELIKRFVSVEFNRFLDYYRDAGDLNVDESREAQSANNFTRVFMSIGRKDGLIPPKLIGVINDFVSVRDMKIGKIEIGDTFSFVEIDSRYIDKFTQSFKGKFYNNRPVRVDVAEGQRTRKKSGGSTRTDYKPRNSNDQGFPRQEGKRKWKSDNDPFFGDRNPKEGKKRKRF